MGKTSMSTSQKERKQKHAFSLEFFISLDKSSNQSTRQSLKPLFPPKPMGNCTHDMIQQVVSCIYCCCITIMPIKDLKNFLKINQFIKIHNASNQHITTPYEPRLPGDCVYGILTRKR